MTKVARYAYVGVAVLSTLVLLSMPSPALAQSRYEQTDPSVTYSAGWSQDSSRAWSGGTAAISTTPGARIEFAFNGPSVSWIGGRAPWSGIARVSLDGVFLAEVDTYSKTEEIRVPMFTSKGLANTGHTLTIEATGRMNPAATSTYVVVDSFDVPAPAVSRLQETDPDVSYSAGLNIGQSAGLDIGLAAGWVQDNALYVNSAGLLTGWTQGFSLRNWSAGTAILSAAPGAQATFTFTGTGVSWIGARGNQTGIADIILDGARVAEIDTYSPKEQIQAEIFRKTGLTNTPHTLTIQVTGRQNAASQSALIIVDAFEVTSPGIQVQETDPSITYGVGWIQNNRDKAYSQGSSAESATAGGQANFTFTGTGVSWIGARGPQCGIARVFLDGTFMQDIDTYARTEGPQHTDFTATGLAPGTHTLTIQVLGKNPVSTNSWILVDAFNVLP